MASTYTTGFGIEKIGSGEQSGTWGTTTNHNLDIVDRIASYKAVGLSGTTHTLTVREASPGSGTENLQDGMYRVIKFTGALGANNTVTIAPNTSPAWFIIENATTDSGSSGPYSVILTQGSGANVTVQNGKNAIIYCDGAGSGAVVYDALADIQVGTLEVTGAAAIDGALTQGGASQFNSTLTVGVNDTGYDVKLFGATSGAYMLWDESADDLKLVGAAGLTVAGDIDVDGTTNLDAVDIDGAVQLDSTLTVGVNDTGYDVKFFGATAGAHMLWDESADDLKLVGAAGLTVAGNSVLASVDVTGLATAATFEPDGDTAAGDNAAIGYTAAEGLILTGQGSTSDITFKNDADATVMSIPTGTTNVGVAVTAPTEKLTVHGAIRSTASSANFALGVAGAFMDMASGIARIGTVSGASALTGSVSFVANNTEKARLLANGNFGLGTTAAASLLHLSANQPELIFQWAANYSGQILFKEGTTLTGAITMHSPSDTVNDVLTGDQQDGNMVLGTGASGAAGEALVLVTNGVQRMTLDNAGNVGVGTSSPVTYDDDFEVFVAGNGNNFATIQGRTDGPSGEANGVSYGASYGTKPINYARIRYAAQGSAGQIGLLAFHTKLLEDDTSQPLERMRILANGKVGIGTTAPGHPLHVVGDGAITGHASIGVNSVASTRALTVAGATDGTGSSILVCYNSSLAAQFQVRDDGLVSAAGNLAVTGSVSKGSGSFKIDHPLPAKKDTHDLVHSFIEGPQADLIYRGRATLSGGTVDVNIDTAAGMSEGTFVLLCTDVQCFTSNEEGWTALKGAVSGNILTITAQDDTCTDTVSWMVIGERCDPHILDTEWTDDNGKVIVEPLKS